MEQHPLLEDTLAQASAFTLLCSSAEFTSVCITALEFPEFISYQIFTNVINNLFKLFLALISSI